MPSPIIPQIEIGTEKEEEQEVLRETVRRVYDICADDAALRKRHQEFDRLRAEYPVRREFFNTQLRLRGRTPELRGRLLALGFAE
jgi:erythronate-4-phosphate dehydrogenase